MTDNEIIKALERCIECNNRHIANCDGCLLEHTYPECDSEIEYMCLDLINRQKSEIDDLLEQLSNADYDHSLWKQEKRLVEAEAVKEFAERLKVEMADKKYKYVTETNYSKTVNAVIDACIDATDNLVKEFTEGKADD